MNALQILATLRNAIKIVSSTLNPEKSLGQSEQDIISKIHRLRFNPQNNYLTTGSHFSDLFVRNMGIFYNSLLDPRIPSTTIDWEERQEICYKTISYALKVFSKAKHDYTTISPFTSTINSNTNVYARASDSLYAILYGIKMLLDPQIIPARYPSPTQSKNPTKTLSQTAATLELLDAYRPHLTQLIEKYLQEILDPHTGLVAENILLSSARDGIKRRSSFYDNVIAWATTSLAFDLQIPLQLPQEQITNLTKWRERIIQAFWNPQLGIFNDDLYTTSFSADQLVAITTNFLNLHSPSNRAKYHSIIQFIQNHSLDQPFPIHYSQEHSPQKLYWPVRYFAPHYMTHSIWSHWGIEYIKLLILLSPDNPNFLTRAQQHLQSYKHNIEKYGGYPECYDLKGNPLREGLYRTVLHTSWVINYEQACALFAQYQHANQYA